MKAQMFHYDVWLPYQPEKSFAAACEQALIESGFCILKQCEHFFPVQGYTGLWLLSESHFALHSFPEANQIYAELTSCVKEPFEKMKVFLKAQEKEL